MRGASVMTVAGVAAVSVQLLVAQSLDQPNITVLTADTVVHRHLSRTGEDRFLLTLAAGTVATIRIDQTGTGVTVSVRDNADTLVAEFQNEFAADGGTRVELVASHAGPYMVRITPAPGAVAESDYTLRMDAPREATGADRRMQEARRLRAVARESDRKGQFAAARPLLEQALAITQTVRAEDDTDVAIVQFELAGNALERQDDAASRTMYEHALRTFEEKWGPAHPCAAMARSRLALLDQRSGERLKSELAVREVLPVLERALGRSHPWYLQSLATLANLRESAGDLAQAEQIDRDALATVNATGQTGTLLEAELLNNLADVLRARRDYAGAEPLFARSLAIGESLLGEESLFVATALQNLGIMARERKDYPGALALYGHALSIRERMLGPDHPSLAGVLTNLANVYRATGADQKALDTQFRALEMREKTVGPYGRETLLVVGNVARTYAGIGDIDNALKFQRRADAILEAQMSLYLATGSERQKLAFVRNEADRTDRTVSLHLKEAPDNAEAASLAALVLLQ